MLCITQKIKHIFVPVSVLLACLVVVGILLVVPSRAFAESKTFALACKPNVATATPDTTTGDVSCEGGSAPNETAYIAGVGAQSTYPKNVGLTVVSVNCGSSQAVASKLVKGADASKLECHNGKVPKITITGTLNTTDPNGTTSSCDYSNGTCASCYTSDLTAAQKKANPNICNTCASGTACSDSAIKCSRGNCDLVATYVDPFIKVLSGLVGLVVIISLIVGGVQYSASEGDPQKAAQAKSRITKTVFAFIVFIFLFALLQFLVPGGIFNR
jgi:hypothetical protein